MDHGALSNRELDLPLLRSGNFRISDDFDFGEVFVFELLCLGFEISFGSLSD